VKAPSRARRVTTGLVVCTLCLPSCKPEAPIPRDLSRWNWQEAQEVASIVDALSALHLRADGTLLGLDDDGFVVSIASLETDAPAEGWPRWPLAGGGDLEGLCGTDSADVLVLLEDRSELVRLGSNGRRIATHTLDAQIPRGEQGLEGLAWIPSAQGGASLWLGHQGQAKVYVVRAPSGPEESKPLELLRVLDLEDEARGLVFDPDLGAVLAVVDEAREVWMVELNGRIRDRRAWPKGTRDVEGITLGPGGCLLLALDGGGVWRIPAVEG